MAERITFKEWLAAGNDFTIPEISGIDESIPTATRALIEDWFNARRVLNYNFPEFLQREINLNYPYYIELLRIDPSVSDFDWFVDNYNEREIIRSGNDTDTTDTTDTTTRKGREVFTKTGAINRTRSGNEVEAIAGTETDTQSGTEKDTTKNATAAQSMDRQTAFTRQSPMSAEYSTSGSVGETALTVGAAGEVYTIGTPSDSYNRPNILNPTGTSDGMTESASVNEGATETTHEYTDRKTTREYNGRTNTRTYNNVTDAESYTDYKEERIQGDGAGAEIPTEETKHGGTVTHGHDTTDHEISTGRNQNPANLLDAARAYIMKSRAWLWFYDKLNDCFLNVYEVEDYGY